MGVLLANIHETAGASQAGVKLEPAPVKPTSKPEDLRAGSSRDIDGAALRIDTVLTPPALQHIGV
jgi:hypothetical protein